MLIVVVAMEVIVLMVLLAVIFLTGVVVMGSVTSFVVIAMEAVVQAQSLISSNGTAAVDFLSKMDENSRGGVDL